MKTKQPIKIKKGQKWRSKQRRFMLIVGAKIKDGWWSVYTPTMKRKHSMEECSFHFFQLVE